MKPLIVIVLAACLAPSTFAQAPQQKPDSRANAVSANPPAQSPDIQKKLENYLRDLYAWGPEFKLKISPLRAAPVAGLYEFNLDVTMDERTDSGVFYVSADARFLIRGDIQDMSRNPFADTRANLNLTDTPSKGPANARVTIVEFADFQCPSCRELHNILREMEPQYPQVRIVFKDFPLAQLHPWAMTAASAARCAYLQDHAAFWKLYDQIYDGQDLISAENVWTKLIDYAGQDNLDTAALRTCMTADSTAQYLNHAIKEGQQLRIANTPTIFVNGRRVIGPDRATLEQFIRYELSLQPTHADAPSHP